MTTAERQAVETAGVTMRRVLQTDLGNAIAWGFCTFGILAGCAGLLWLVGVATGGN